MERHGGRDHLTVLGRSAWEFDTCNETHGHGSALGEAFRVSVDGGPIITGAMGILTLTLTPTLTLTLTLTRNPNPNPDPNA